MMTSKRLEVWCDNDDAVWCVSLRDGLHDTCLGKFAEESDAIDSAAQLAERMGLRMYYCGSFDGVEE